MARLLAAVNSVSYLLFSTIGIPNVERWGRRKMLMYAAAGQCFCYLIITVMIRYNELPGYAHQTEVAKASVAFFFLYYVFFGIGFQVWSSKQVYALTAADQNVHRAFRGYTPLVNAIYTWKLARSEANSICRNQLAIDEK